MTGTSKMTDIALPRRRLLAGLGAGAGGLLLGGCDALNANAGFRGLLMQGEALHQGSQRLITDRQALAREFSRSDIAPRFRANGNTAPDTPAYLAHVDSKFADWRLGVDGLVARPLSLSLAAIRAMPVRTQITRHDCVEGWSAIGEWAGVPLALLLKQAGLSSRARYIVFHCADLYGGAPYYESIDLIDAFHAQTILAWRMNGEILPVAHGAPLRLRVERQLGYKHAKYVERIEARASIADLHGGKGGLWEDRSDYPWYAGI